MTPTPQTWTTKAFEALRSLAARPASAFLLLLALNAAARPYLGIVHDARLYSAQVLNQVDAGCYADDLFFRFGSQDQFSLFSRLAAPLAGIFGIEPTFFFLYLIFNTLFLFALKRFVERLISDRVLSTLALCYLVVAPLPFGGLNVFSVHEPFLTPRIMANALLLIGLDQVLQGRFGRALLWLALGGAMHPLMACGGLLVWAGCLAVAVLSRRQVLVLGAALTVLAIAVLAIPSLGLAVFGAMDDEWRQVVRQASPYNFPDEWAPRDWINVGFSFGALLAAATWWPTTDPRRATFLWVLAGVGFIGLLGTWIGSYLPYALFFQGQPYRALWLLKVVQAPLLFLIVARLLQGENRLGQAAALVLSALYGLTSAVPLEICFPLFFFPIIALAKRGLESEPRDPRWLVHSGAASLLLGFCGWTLYKIVLIVQGSHTLLAHIDPLEFVALLLFNLGPAVWLAATLALLIRLAPGGFGRRFAAGAFAGALLLPVAWFTIPQVSAYRQNLSRYGQDVDFLQNYLTERWQDNKVRPTVYSFMGRVNYLWVDARAKSYFDFAQIVGVLFNRQTAMEGQRRARIAGPFEIERCREEALFIPAEMKEYFQTIFQQKLDGPPPGIQDLERLCREDGVDFVVLKQKFAGLEAAGNGRITIYDCRQVRAALNRQGPEPDALARAGVGFAKR